MWLAVSTNTLFCPEELTIIFYQSLNTLLKVASVAVSRDAPLACSGTSAAEFPCFKPGAQLHCRLCKIRAFGQWGEWSCVFSSFARSLEISISTCLLSQGKTMALGREVLRLPCSAPTALGQCPHHQHRSLSRSPNPMCCSSYLQLSAVICWVQGGGHAARLPHIRNHLACRHCGTLCSSFALTGCSGLQQGMCSVQSLSGGIVGLAAFPHLCPKSNKELVFGQICIWTKRSQWNIRVGNCAQIITWGISKWLPASHIITYNLLTGRTSFPEPICLQDKLLLCEDSANSFFPPWEREGNHASGRRQRYTWLKHSVLLPIQWKTQVPTVSSQSSAIIMKNTNQRSLFLTTPLQIASCLSHGSVKTSFALDTATSRMTVYTSLFNFPGTFSWPEFNEN